VVGYDANSIEKVDTDEMIAIGLGCGCPVPYHFFKLFKNTVFGGRQGLSAHDLSDNLERFGLQSQIITANRAKEFPKCAKVFESSREGDGRTSVRIGF